MRFGWSRHGRVVIVRVWGIVDKTAFESPKVEAMHVPLPQVCVTLLLEEEQEEEEEEQNKDACACKGG